MIPAPRNPLKADSLPTFICLVLNIVHHLNGGFTEFTISFCTFNTPSPSIRNVIYWSYLLIIALFTVCPHIHSGLPLLLCLPVGVQFHSGHFISTILLRCPDHINLIFSLTYSYSSLYSHSECIVNVDSLWLFLIASTSCFLFMFHTSTLHNLYGSINCFFVPFLTPSVHQTH